MSDCFWTGLVNAEQNCIQAGGVIHGEPTEEGTGSVIFISDNVLLEGAVSVSVIGIDDTEMYQSPVDMPTELSAYNLVIPSLSGPT